MTLISTFNLEGERIERAGLALEGRERDGWKPSHLDVERDGLPSARWLARVKPRDSPTP
jgi:hypothetical protein